MSVTTPVARQTSRRRLMIVAISDYPNETPEFSASIRAQVEEVERWWLNPALGPDRVFEPVRQMQAVTMHSLYTLRAEEEFEYADDDEALVVYITGHGMSPPGCGRHFLQLRDTDQERIPGTALWTTSFLAPILDSQCTHVLIMVDSCFSGVLRSELQGLMRALSTQRRELSSLLVITSGGERSMPAPGEFAAVLRETRRRIREDESLGFIGPYLSVEDFTSVMVRVRDEPGSREPLANVQFVWPEDCLDSKARHQNPHYCLPNPAHVPSRARSDSVLEPFWREAPFASTSEARDQCFFGEHLLQPLSRFLHAGSGAMIVTGSAGSGKSSLLGYVVAFSDRDFREAFANPNQVELLPPLGSVNAASRVVRNRTVDALAEDLLRQLDPSVRVVPGTHLAQMLLEGVTRLLKADGRLVTMVIDGLDEADDPERMVTDLVCPLLALRGRDGKPGVRLLLSVRSERGEVAEASDGLLGRLISSTVGGQRKLLRTDDRVQARKHIERFALHVLASEWGDGNEDLEVLAKVISEEVTPSFLDARIAAEQLNSRSHPDDLPDPKDPEWRADLSQGTRQLLLRDIEATAGTTGVSAETLVAVLRALAFAEGEGLPWADVWPGVVEELTAQAICTTEATTGIRAVLGGQLVGYLVRGELDGRRIYGLIHERVAELLCGDLSDLLPGRTLVDWSVDAVETHRRFAVALTDLLSEGELPHEYIRHFLIAHADRGGALNDGLIPSWFLTMDRSGQVRTRLGLLREGTEENLALSAQATLEPWLDPSDTQGTRVDSLALATCEHPTPVTARDLVPQWRDFAVRGNVLVDERQGGVSAATFFRPGEDGPRVAVGDARGGVVVWDVHGGTVVGEPIQTPGEAAVTALAVARHPKGSVCLFSGTKEGVRLHVPGRRQPEKPLLDRSVSAMIPDSGRGARLTIGTDRGLVRFDPWKQEVVREAAGFLVKDLSILDRPGGRSPLLAVVQLDRVQILLADTWDTVVTIEARDGGAFAQAALYADEEGEPRLATVDPAGGFRVWNALTGNLLHHDRALAVTSLTRFDRPGRGTLLGLGRADRSVWLWDPERGRSHRRFPQDHAHPVTAMTVVSDGHGSLALASGSPDGSLRLWNPQAGPVSWKRSSASGVRLVACPDKDGRLRVLSAGQGNTVHARAAREGTLLAPPAHLDSSRLPRRITAMFAFEHRDRGWLMVSGWPDGTIGFHAVEGKEACPRIDLGPGHPTAFATLESSEARSLLMVGTSEGAVAFCDPITGDYGHLRLDGPAVLDLAALRAPDALLAAATEEGVSVWRPGQTEPQMLEDFGSARSLTGLGEKLVVGDAHGLIRSWSPSTGALTEFVGHRGTVAALAPLVVAGEGVGLVSAGADDTTVRVWDPRSGRELYRLVTGMSLTSLCLPQEDGEPRGHLIVFGGPAGAAAVTVPWPGR